jgi:hypothetical protein
MLVLTVGVEPSSLFTLHLYANLWITKSNIKETGNLSV